VKSSIARLLPLLFAVAACGSNNAELPPDLLDAIRESNGPVSYPEGPYGTKVGDTLPELCFQGWRDPAAAEHDPNRAETVCLSSFNQDGRARVLLVNSSALWCVACRAEYGGSSQRPSLAERLDERRDRGFRILGSLFETNDPEPATLRDASTWSRAYSLDFPFVVDDTYSLGESNIAPTNRVVDARTMKVLLELNGDEPAVLFSFIDDRLDD
jgi:hypothetical protein